MDHNWVRKVYLPSWPREDSVYWNLTRDGQYTVKSGYWLANKLSIDASTPTAPLAVHPDIATRIWKFQIAPKLKHFMWRVASRAIGTAANLLHRNIRVNQYCPRCCIEKESSDHILFSCRYVVAAWRATGKLRHIFTIHKDS